MCFSITPWRHILRCVFVSCGYGISNSSKLNITIIFERSWFRLKFGVNFMPHLLVNLPTYIDIDNLNNLFSSIQKANTIGFSFGWSNAWANANFLHLTSNETILNKPLTNAEASYFMSLICAGGLGGNMIYLWIITNFGRKGPILLLGVPAIVCKSSCTEWTNSSNEISFTFLVYFQLSWLLVIYAKNVYWLYASRILCGFVGGAYFIAIPIFVSEICSDRWNLFLIWYKTKILILMEKCSWHCKCYGLSHRFIRKFGWICDFNLL